MNDFLDGLMHSNAFGFIIDESEVSVPIGEPQYNLFTSDYFPFVVLSSELWALNDYCYAILMASTGELKSINEQIRVANDKHNMLEQDNMFTRYELIDGLEEEKAQWQWITDITAAHLVILLYSFLEKSLKYIYEWFVQDSIIYPQYTIRTPKIYYWIYNVLGLDERTFRMEYKETYLIIEGCRKIRNNFAHDNLEGVEREGNDYVYDERKLDVSFKFIDFIDTISKLLWEIEQYYEENVIEGKKRIE